MSISQRKHIRLTLDIPAIRFSPEAERIPTVLYQISVGGCLIEWDETIADGDEFRMLVQLPDKNWLPLDCKALYRCEDDGVGIQFENISAFEQSLLVSVMSANLENEGIPFELDPFQKPRTFESEETTTAELGLND